MAIQTLGDNAEFLKAFNGLYMFNSHVTRTTAKTVLSYTIFSAAVQKSWDLHAHEHTSLHQKTNQKCGLYFAIIANNSSFRKTPRACFGNDHAIYLKK